MTTSDGRVVSTTKVIDNGPDNLRWNLVIVGDGYRASEISQYHTDVQNFLTTFAATPPFDNLSRGITVYRIDVKSTDSEADDPSSCPGGTGTTANTYFDSTYCSVAPGGVRLDRLLTIDSSLAITVARNNVPMQHQVLCIVNSSKYGGSGGIVATCSTHSQSSQIAIHEMGHSAFGLADEYGGNGTGTPSGEPHEPNVTRDTNRATNKWRSLIVATTPRCPLNATLVVYHHLVYHRLRRPQHALLVPMKAPSILTAIHTDHFLDATCETIRPSALYVLK